MPLLDDRVPVGELDQRAEVLVDEQDGLTLVLQAGETFPNFEAQQRREPLGCLVENEQLGVRHQGAPDRQHLLFAAGQFIAHVASSFGELRKKAVDPVERPSRGREARRGRRDQVLLDGEGWKDLPPLGNEPETSLRDSVWRQADQGQIVENGSPAARWQQPHDGVNGGRLAHAVAAQQGDHLAGADPKADVEQHLRGAIGGLQMVDCKHRGLTPSRRRDRRPRPADQHANRRVRRLR